MRDIFDKNFTGFLLCIGVFALAGFLFLYQLGDKPFWDYDEAIYANVIHDTSHSANVWSPSLEGTPWFEKPPLYLWTSMAADKLFDHPEFSYRLTAALAGLISVVLAMLISYDLTGSMFIAALAGLLLLATGPFLEGGREVRLDVPVTAAALFAVYSFIRAQRSSAWYIGIGVAMAVGFLFKSVIVGCAALFVVIWSLMHADFSWLKSRYFWIGAAAGLAILLPWHLYQTMLYGGAFWSQYFFYHALGHFGNDIVGGSTSPLGYFKFFLTYAAPWSALFFVAIAWLGSRYLDDKSPAARQSLAFLLTGLAIFAVFLVSSTRLLFYLIPVFPFAAIGLALGFGYAFARMQQRHTRALALCALGVCLIGGLWSSVYFGFHLYSDLHDNDVIVSDEQKAGVIIGQNPQPQDVYALQYDYWNTLEYYSGGRQIQTIDLGQPLDHSFMLITSTYFIKGHPFAPVLLPHLQQLYQGDSLTLYKFIL